MEAKRCGANRGGASLPQMTRSPCWARFTGDTCHTPEPPDCRPVRLATLDRVLKEKFVDTGELPGTLIRILHHGEVVHTGSAGMMDIERQKPMREDAIFRIYSMSKPITAVALMMLVEEGRLALYDDVSLHIPAWKDLGVFAGGTLGAFRTRPPDPADEGDRSFHPHLGLTYSWMNNSNVDAAYRALDLHEPHNEGASTA